MAPGFVHSSTQSEGAALGNGADAGAKTCGDAKRGLQFYRQRESYWRTKMGAVPPNKPARLGDSCPHIRLLAKLARNNAAQSRLSYAKWLRKKANRFRQLYEKWRCIHEHEGAWDSNTGNGYWGGLQMDWGFMHTYGPEFIRQWGTADRWPVFAQLIAAERAFHGYAGYKPRGFHPWGTAYMCGLL